MSRIGPAHLHGPQSLGAPHSPQASKPGGRPDSAPIRDEVDISDVARLVEQARHAPEIRSDLVETIRAKIAQQTYETPEKLGIAVERLLDEIG